MCRCFFVGVLALFQVGSVAGEEKFPPELVRFQPEPNEPVFTGGPPGAWDEQIRERGWILREGDSWRLWYTGYTGKPGATMKLGSATSTDGIRWTRTAAEPIYQDHWTEDMMVLRIQDRFLMFAEGKNDRAHLLQSRDGTAWERIGRLDIRLKDGSPIPKGPYGTPTVWFENDIWHLFYERFDKGIWLATSKDLRVWTNESDEPILKPGPADHERDLIAANQVIRHKGRYYLLYHGAKARGGGQTKWTTNIAVSTDLRQWEKYRANPLLPIDWNRSSGILIADGERFLLYTMHPVVYRHVFRPLD